MNCWVISLFLKKNTWEYINFNSKVTVNNCRNFSQLTEKLIKYDFVIKEKEREYLTDIDYTSSHATTVGPFHCANGNLAIIACSNNSSFFHRRRSSGTCGGSVVLASWPPLLPIVKDIGFGLIILLFDGIVDSERLPDTVDDESGDIDPPVIRFGPLHPSSSV